MAIGKRTGIDFSKHQVIVTQSEGLLVHYLRKPNTIHDSIRYINTNGILAVNGDYGNWIFCREFHPSADGFVSDEYWKQKLRNSSTQEPDEYSQELTISRINEKLNFGLVDYGYEGEQLADMKEYLKECLNYANGSEYEYEAYAYQNYPSFTDSDCVVNVKITKYWLKAIFDGFDEMCRRLKEEINLQNA